MDVTKIQSIISKHPVVVFSKEACHFCELLYKDLEAMKVPYKKVILDNETNLRDELVEYTKQTSVPQLFIGGNFIGGYKQFSSLCVSHKFETLLAPFNINPLIDF